MRTDNLPNNISQSSSLTSKAQEINLSNQLFGSSDNAESFDRVLNSQVQAREPKPSAVQERPEKEVRQEANSRAESGKRLPDDRADRLQEKQQTDKQRQDDASDARQAESGRDGKARSAEARNEQGQQDRVRQEDAREGDYRSSKERALAQSEAQQQDQVRREAGQDAASTDVQDSGAVADAEVSEQPIALLQEQGNEQPTQLDDYLMTQEAAGVDHEVASKDEPSDIVISPELLANAGVADDISTEQRSPAAEVDLLVDLTDEERLALKEASDTPVQIEGEGFQELAADVEPDAVVPVIVDGLSRQSIAAQAEANSAEASMLGSKKEAPKPVITPSMNPNSLAGSDNGDPNGIGNKATNTELSASEEFPVFEPKGDKKSDMGVLADKMQVIKPAVGEGVAPSPVQERLAALAKALDKAAASPVSQSSAKAVESVDNAKATPFQRSLEQMSRAPANLAKPFSTNIQTPMQSREWAGEMGQRLMMMVSSKLSSAQIQLNPREMGPIDVKVSVQHDQASVVFTSHAAPTRDALEQALPKLREMMEQNGVALGDVDVRDHDARESHERRGQEQRQGGSNRSDIAGVDDTASEQVIQQPIGLVDYYA